jgi:hypothetical protein
MTFSGTSTISLGTKSERVALGNAECRTPDGGVMVMPMVISLFAPIAGSPGSARTPRSPPRQIKLLHDSSLGFVAWSDHDRRVLGSKYD